VKVHLMGIGGAGVSSLAQVLASRGESVSGCDVRPSQTTERLARAGVTVAIGHDPGHVAGQDLLVYSAAVDPDSAEVRAAQEAGIRAISRAQLLADLIAAGPAVAVAGTHGKTTTTHMTGQVMVAGGLDPTVLVGDGASTRVGQGSWLVAEADESDGSLVLHHPSHAVLTNLELDHPDHYRDLAAVRDVFERFLAQVGELAVVCAEDEELMRLPAPRRVTYGIESGDYQAVRLGLRVGVPGRHNLLNATGAAALALELGVEEAVVRSSLADFSGSHRRFELVGRWRGSRLYDDYGHHPTEVRATLQAAGEIKGEGRVVVVFQPHRYSRLAGLLDEFAGSFEAADEVIITEVYAAGEKPNGIGGRDLAERAPGAVFAAGPEEIRDALAVTCRPGDLVLFMGAGDIWKVAHALAE
jgi:UDP-N-acetylmuramate--alanine ligase